MNSKVFSTLGLIFFILFSLGLINSTEGRRVVVCEEAYSEG
ncbi:MAG: hypothetical protein ABIK61_02980 [candidate division WOR-3 bacterium]